MSELVLPAELTDIKNLLDANHIPGVYCEEIDFDDGMNARKVLVVTNTNSPADIDMTADMETNSMVDIELAIALASDIQIDERVEEEYKRFLQFEDFLVKLTGGGDYRITLVPQSQTLSDTMVSHSFAGTRPVIWSTDFERLARTFYKEINYLQRFYLDNKDAIASERNRLEL